jgi:hypothetical protein
LHIAALSIGNIAYELYQLFLAEIFKFFFVHVIAAENISINKLKYRLSTYLVNYNYKLFFNVTIPLKC